MDGPSASTREPLAGPLRPTGQRGRSEWATAGWQLVRARAPDSPDAIEESQQYLRDFARVASEQDGADAIVAEMLKLHGERDNPYTLWLSARRIIANRG